MSVAHLAEEIFVWTEHDRPVRLVWRGDRYLVTDTPTPISESLDHDALTHPAQRVIGWRFQGRSISNGETRVFDARQLAGTRWELTGVYA